MTESIAKGTADATESEDDSLTLLDLLQVLADHLRLLILGPIVAGLLALAYSYRIPPTYTANARFVPPQQAQSSAAAMLQGLGALGAVGGGAASAFKNPVDQYVAFVSSRSIQDALIDRFNLAKYYGAKSMDGTRGVLDGAVQVTAGKDGLITIEATDKDPKFAAELANAHIDELKNLMTRLAVTEAQQRRVFFERHLNSTKEQLIKAELALGKSGVNSSVLRTSPQSTVETVARLRATITAQEVKLTSMREYLTESASPYKQAASELNALRAQLSRLGGNDTNTGGDGDYVAKYREFKYQETLFELFARQFEMARVDESREGSAIQVLDTAYPPERKSGPKRLKMSLLAALFTGIVLTIFVFARSRFQSFAQDPESQEKMTQLRRSLARAFGRG